MTQEAARIYGEVCLWLLRLRWRLSRRQPVLITIARFEGDAEWGKALQSELLAALRERLGEHTEPGLLCTWRRVVGPATHAQRLCRRRRTACLLYGVRGDDGQPVAHVVFGQGELIRHIDSYSGDVTAVDRATPSEPSPASTRIQACTVGEIAEQLALFIPEKLRSIGMVPAGERPDAAPAPLPDGEDELVDELHCLRAQALAGVGQLRGAHALISARLARRRSPRLLAQAYLLVGMGDAAEHGVADEDAHLTSLALLREASEFRDYPDRPTVIYNLLQILPAGDGDGLAAERWEILAELCADPTYRRAWWVERMRGALRYYEATRARAVGGDHSARPIYRRAARHYSRALRLRRRARQLDPELGPSAPRRLPRPPVLRANAYDAHHFAGHPLRAAWHHFLAAHTVRRLFKLGLRAMGRSDWLTASFAFQRLLTVGWSDETAARANVFAATAARQLEDAVSSEAFWERALQIDRRVATQVRAELRAAGAVSGLTRGLPGDSVEVHR